MIRETVRTSSFSKSVQTSIRAEDPAAESRAVYLSPALLCAGSVMAIYVGYVMVMILLTAWQ